MRYSVYILENPEGEFYKGHTSDLASRIDRHNAGRSKYTKGKGPWKLVYSEDFETKAEAVRRELQIKKWSRNMILNLIRANNQT